ncbi:MAG: hypothetical protein COU33_04050, partial [Candidatus Magasanikbacteria bacterium CG10_big_fil_rev_8_21_14_0_10_43_6]
MRISTFLLACFVWALPITVCAADTPWYRYTRNDTTGRAVQALGPIPVTQIPIPILFGISVGDFAPNFGVPRSGGRTHEGQDIVALLGTPIVSPTNAVVTHIRYGASAGHSVYTANPGNQTFAYLHLDRIHPGLAVGDVLERGDVLGYVGDTGNASGGAAHLHFEILEHTPLDPFPRLTKNFTAKEKITFAEKLLADLPPLEANDLRTFLRASFPNEFVATASVEETAPQPSTNSAAGRVLAAAPTDLTHDATGEGVTMLQLFLINERIGKQGKALEEVGATGYFGEITYLALREYQQTVGIIPADGVYNADTRAQLRRKAGLPKVIENPVTTQPTPPVEAVPTPTAVATSPLMLAGMPQINLSKDDT